MSESIDGPSRIGYPGALVEESKAFSLEGPGKKPGGRISPGLECPEMVCYCASDFLLVSGEKPTTELPRLGLLPSLSDLRAQQRQPRKEQRPHLPGKPVCCRPLEITIPGAPSSFVKWIYTWVSYFLPKHI